MQKSKAYRAKFLPEVLTAARAALDKHAEKQLIAKNMRARMGEETWVYDDETQFFSKYRKDECVYATWDVGHHGPPTNVDIVYSYDETRVNVMAAKEAIIEEVFEVFERAYPACKYDEEQPPPPPEVRPLVFIGHGGKSKEWLELQNHLANHHNYQVHAFESGARSGHAIRDILDNVVQRSDFAILVYTAEDDMADGSKRARENVVHETGLFQGKLGFHRAIVLLERGIDLFSNLDGIQYIGFSKGNIRETYGDVLATLRREFGNAR